VIAVVAGALLLRLIDLDVRAIHHDESLHATYSWYFVRAAPLYHHDPLMHGPFQFHAMAAAFLLLGDNEFAARLPAALAGTALVATPLLLRRLAGQRGHGHRRALLALSPSILYYSRFAREDIYAALWTALLFIAVWRYREDGRDRWLALAAGALGLAFCDEGVRVPDGGDPARVLRCHAHARAARPPGERPAARAGARGCCSPGSVGAGRPVDLDRVIADAYGFSDASSGG
jgi:uncharacterized protein (TIGR03663 family)